MDEESPTSQILSKYKIPILVTLVGTVLLIGGVVTSGIIPRIFLKSNTNNQKIQSSQLPSVKTLRIDISGAVNKPGVYELSSNSIIKDAIISAGGVTTKADPEYLTKRLNLAQKISDGMKIYIPFEGEQISTGISSVGGDVAGASTGIISINQGSLSELDSLTGIGPVTAQKIIDGRPYNDLSELLSKKVVTKAVYEKIKDKISL